MSDVNPVDCSIDQLQLPVDVPALSDKPSYDEMLVILDKFVKWDQFAVHLSGVTQSLINRIKRVNHPSSRQKKVFVLEWLKPHYSASWRHVLIALNKAQEDELFVTVLYSLKTKRPLTTQWRASASKDDVIADARTLCKVFTKLLIDIKSSLNELVQQGTYSLPKIADEIGKHLEIERLSRSANIDELFIKVPYCTYLNCELIEYLLNKFPVRSCYVTERGRKYCQKLKQFRKSSHLLYLTAALKSPVCTITSTTADVSLRLSNKWNQLSLHNLMRAIQYWFGSERLYLNHIIRQKEILHVQFITPQSHVQSLQSLAVANRERLHQLGVVEMYIKGVSVIGKEELENFEVTCLRVAEAGDCGLILLLLELGVPLDCTNEEGQTPLMVAVFNEQLQAIQTLVYTGADANISDINGYTALTTALKMKNIKPDIIKLLLDALHIEPAQQMSLFQLCTEDNSEKLEHFLSTPTNVDINYQTPGGVTALMIASVFGYESIVDVLLKYKCNINIETECGWTALSFAIQHGKPHIEQKLQQTAGAASAGDVIPENRLTVSELIKLFEFLIKQQVTHINIGAHFNANIEKIQAIAKETKYNDYQKMALLMQCIEEDPNFLESLRQAMIDTTEDTRKQNRTKDVDITESSSAECKTLRENFADLVDLVAGNAAVIVQLSNLFLSSSIIPKIINISLQNDRNSSYERASQLFTSVLLTLEINPNPNTVFSAIVQSLSKVGLHAIATKLVNCLGKNGGHIAFQISTDSMQYHSAIIQLNSRDEVATGINTLHNQFTEIVVKLMDRLKECVSTGSVSLNTIANYVGQHLQIQDLTKASTIYELFDSIMPHYDFFNYDVIEVLINRFLSSEDELQTELAQYTESVERFEELSQLKHIRSVISERLPVISDNENTSKVVIKLNGRWGEMTKKNLKKILEHYFGSDTLFHHIRITPGSVCVTLLVSTSQCHSLIDKVTSKTESMKLIGIFEMYINKQEIVKEEEDNIDFEHSLCQSASTGMSFETSILLQLGANPNGQDEQGNTALILATEGEHIQTVKDLVTAGADTSKTNDEGRTVLMTASEKNNRELMECLLKANTVQQKYQIKQLELFHQTKAELLQEKLSLLSVQLKEREEQNQQLLDDIQKLRAQLQTTERQESVELKERIGQNQLLLKNIRSLQFEQENLSAQLETEKESFIKNKGSFMEIVEHLLSDPNVQRKHQQTVLTLACESGNHSVIEALLQENIDVDIQLTNGSTPLILASQNGHHTVVKLLLEAKANCNVKDREGRTALIAASQGGHYKVIELLVQQQQTELNSVDKNGYTALHHACQNGSIEIVSLLLQKQAISRSCTNNGSTALMLASQHGHLPIIELLYTHNQYYSQYEGLEAISVADSPEIVHLLADKCDISNHSTLTIEELKTVAKREMKRGDTGRVEWGNNGVLLTSPSVQQCREINADLKDNHQYIHLQYSSVDIVLLLLPAVLQRETVKKLVIGSTSLTLQCIQSLSYLLTINKSLETLELNRSAITDELLECLCLSLQHNYTLTSLNLQWNKGITSNSACSLSNLLLINSTLTELDLAHTSLSSDGVIVLLNSLTDNKTLKILRLDTKHETTCHQHPNYTLIEHKLNYYSLF